MAKKKDALSKIGELYEEGKDCLNSLGIIDNSKEYLRVYEILQELRDIAAVNSTITNPQHNN